MAATPENGDDKIRDGKSDDYAFYIIIKISNVIKLIEAQNLKKSTTLSR